RVLLHGFPQDAFEPEECVGEDSVVRFPDEIVERSVRDANGLAPAELPLEVLKRSIGGDGPHSPPPRGTAAAWRPGHPSHAAGTTLTHANARRRADELRRRPRGPMWAAAVTLMAAATTARAPGDAPAAIKARPRIARRGHGNCSWSPTKSVS